MKVPTVTQLLDIWERGRAASPGERALLLLGAVSPDTAPEQLAALSVGRRDAVLLELRAQTFGRRLACLSACPHCGERVEMDFPIEEILLPSPADVPAEQTVVVGDYHIVFRLPNSHDLVMLGRDGTEDAPERQILHRCIITARKGSEALRSAELPAEVVDAVEGRMAEVDPQAEVELALTCPACASQWQAIFDIVAFFWREIDAWAHRLLNEVHTLASRYGWSERDIFALPSWRRHFYLELIGR